MPIALKILDNVCCSKEFYYQDEITFDKQLEFEFQKETDNMLHLPVEHCYLWTRNIDFKWNLEQKYLERFWMLFRREQKKQCEQTDKLSN